MKRFFGVVSCIFVVSLLAGCASISRGPDWTVKGSGAYQSEAGKAFYGVGRASSEIKDKSLRIEAADNRARADIQRIFDTYTSYLMKDYQGQEGGSVERAMKTFSAGHISGIQIIDHYTDIDGMVCSLAKIDLETFKKNIALMKELSDSAREFIQKRADAMFEQLGKEEDKRGSK